MSSYTMLTNDQGLTVLVADGERYVIGPDLGLDSLEGFYLMKSDTCACCNQTHTRPPSGPFARNVEELVEMGWAVEESAYEDWKAKGRKYR